jgi:ABC-type sugar transport system permease subunit
MTSAGPLMNAPTRTRAIPANIVADDRARASTGGGGDGGWRIRERAAPYLFLLPYFIVAGVFFLYPLCYATVLAFYRTSGPVHKAWVGLENFRFVLSDPDFHTAVWNTSVFAFFSIFLQLPLSLGLAMMLNARSGKLKSIFRLSIFAPNLVGQVFVAILFSMLFTPRYGLFNRFLHSLFGLGLEQRWLGDPDLVMPALIICSLWMYVGFNMIYFLAALQTVDQSLVEAARIDGAGPGNIFMHVTMPAIAPVATFVVVTSTIGSFQLFELPYILLQGFGPKNSGMTVVGYLYNYAFDNGDLDTGAAVGWVLTFIILIISLIQIRLSGTLRGER